MGSLSIDKEYCPKTTHYENHLSPNIRFYSNLSVNILGKHITHPSRREGIYYWVTDISMLLITVTMNSLFEESILVNEELPVQQPVF